MMTSRMAPPAASADEEAFGRQFLTEAQILLTTDQFAAFEPFQKKQRQAKIASLKMTAQMFTPGSSRKAGGTD